MRKNPAVVLRDPIHNERLPKRWEYLKQVCATSKNTSPSPSNTPSCSAKDGCSIGYWKQRNNKLWCYSENISLQSNYLFSKLFRHKRPQKEPDFPEIVQMSVDLEFEMRQEYLYVNVTGVFAIAEACRSFSRILEAASPYGATKILVDCLQFNGNPNTLERYTYGEFIAEEVLRCQALSWKFAYVGKPPLLDKGRFTELVANNRGIDGKAFDNIEDALDWLGIASTNKTSGQGEIIDE